MKQLLILLSVLILFLIASVPVQAAQWYAVIYCSGVNDLDSLTTADKESIRDRYVDPVFLASPEWAAMNAAEQWAWIKENILPGVLKSGSFGGVLPVLYHETAGFHLFQNWYKLAQEGTQFVYFAALDYGPEWVPIKAWMDAQSGIEYWHGKSTRDAYRNLWNDRGTQPATAIIKSILRRQVETNDDGEPVAPGAGTGGTTMILIGDALDLGYSNPTDEEMDGYGKSAWPIQLAGH
ncbi:MAG: hypothetical protein GY820_16985 [Gammaproteobacteria bacterium]|nr:hypothetical protein [Gammaproteobacteria bacterium]